MKSRFDGITRSEILAQIRQAETRADYYMGLGHSRYGARCTMLFNRISALEAELSRRDKLPQLEIFNDF